MVVHRKKRMQLICWFAAADAIATGEMHWGSSVTTCKWKLQGLADCSIAGNCNSSKERTTQFIHSKLWRLLLSSSDQIFLQYVCAPLCLTNWQFRRPPSSPVTSLVQMVSLFVHFPHYRRGSVSLMAAIIAAKWISSWQQQKPLGRVTLPGERQPIEKMRLTLAGALTLSLSIPCPANNGASIDLRQINFMAQWAKKVHSMPRWQFSCSLTFSFFAPLSPLPLHSLFLPEQCIVLICCDFYVYLLYLSLYNLSN